MTDIRFQLSGRVSFLKIGDRKAVFSEDLQKIFELNDTAAYLASCMADTPSMADLQKNLERRGGSTPVALETIRKFVTEWSRAKLLSAIVSTRGLRQCRKESLSISGLSFALHHYDAALTTRISPVFAHLQSQAQRDADAFKIVANNSLAYVFQEGRPALVVEPNQAAPALKGILTEALFARAKFNLVLHCAVLVHRGQALLITGPPGAGKTTLTLALLNGGFEYAGDDVTLLMADGTVRGIPYAPAVKPGAWKLSEQFGVSLSGSAIHKRLDGKRVRYLSPAKLALQKPIKVKWIAILKRNASGPVELHPADVSTTLREFVGGAHARNQKMSEVQLRVLVNMISKTHPVVLSYSSANEAAKILEHRCENE